LPGRRVPVVAHMTAPHNVAHFLCRHAVGGCAVVVMDIGPSTRADMAEPDQMPDLMEVSPWSAESSAPI
jgi:hypothetical protein